MASTFYHEAAKLFMTGDIDLETDTIRAMLVDSDYTEDADHDFADDAAAGEYDGAYTRPTLGTVAVTDDDTNDHAEFGSATITFSSVPAGSKDAKGLVIYKFVTNDADSPLICYCEFSSSIMGNNGDITVDQPTEGWLNIG